MPILYGGLPVIAIKLLLYTSNPVCLYVCIPSHKKKKKKAQLRTPGKLIADREGMVMLCMFTDTGVIIQVPFTPELQCSQCAFATTTNW